VTKASTNSSPSKRKKATKEKEEKVASVKGKADLRNASTGDLTKALIHFMASRKSGQPLWQYEDITRTVWSVRSADRIDAFLQHVLAVFGASLPASRLAERWSQLALQLALSCSSRHYAGRSLQIFR